MPFEQPCPCGSGGTLAHCCGPIVDGDVLAQSAEALMRSRFTAFALGEENHLFRSWHPRTRPSELLLDPSTRWLGLRILDTVAGGVDDQRGEVEFEVRFDAGRGVETMRERSLFERRAKRWVYLEALGEHCD